MTIAIKNRECLAGECLRAVRDFPSTKGIDHRFGGVIVVACSRRVTAMMLAAGLFAGPISAQVCTNPYPGPAVSYPIDNPASDVAIGEISGDANRDLVIANDGQNLISVYLSYGDGSFYRVTDSPAGGSISSRQVTDIALGEIDEAWGPDIVATHADVDRLSIEHRAPQLGPGMFTRASSYAAGDAPSDVAVADFDGNGHLDAVSIAADKSVHVFLDGFPSAGGHFGPLLDANGVAASIPVQELAAPTDLDLADLDSDGREDIVYVAGSSLIALQNRQSGLIRRVEFSLINMYSARLGNPLPFQASAVAAGMLNSDWTPDVVVASAADDQLLIFPGKGHLDFFNPDTALGTPAFLSKQNSLPTPPDGILIDDVDGDGRSDLIVLNSGGSGGLTIFKATSSGFAAPVHAATGIQARAFAVGQLDSLASGPDIALAETRSAVSLLFNSCDMPLNIAIKDVEATQVIQDLSPDLALRVPLFADKETIVRVHVKATRSVAPVSATLTATSMSGDPLGQPLRPLNPLGQITVPVVADRANLNHAFLFRLPGEWTREGQIRIRAHVDVPSYDSDASDDSAEQVLSFSKTAKLKIRLVKYIWTDAKGTHEPSEANLAAVESYLRRIMPTATVTFDRSSWTDPGPFLKLSATESDGTYTTWRAAEDALEAITHYVQNNPGQVGPGAITLLLIAKERIAGVAPMASHLTYNTESAAGWIAASNADDPAMAPHEIGHLLGREHVWCAGTEIGKDINFPYTTVGGKEVGQIGEPPGRVGGRHYGFDVGDVSLVPPVLPRVRRPETGDTMSYCEEPWSSRYTYVAMRERMQSLFTGVDPGGDFLQVAGTITQGGAASLTATRFDQAASAPVRVPGPYTLRLISGQNTVLASYPFLVSAPDDSPSLRFMLEIVDFAPGTRRVSVLDPQGSEIGSVAVSASAPAVTLSPVAGDLPQGGSLNLSWAMSDIDGDPLTASVLYSHDNGTTWRLLQGGIHGTSTSIDLADLPGTHGLATGVIRVRASDGVNTAYSQSGGLVVAGKAPRARITSIADAATFALGQTASLAAEFSDLEDGDIGSISWRSDLDGELGTGRVIARQLSEGVHWIVARAKDTDGQTGEDRRVVYVELAPPQGSPPVADAGPDQQVIEGDRVALNGYGSTDGDDDPLLYSWALISQPALPFGAGATLTGEAPTPSFVAPDDGTYRLRLTVSDQRHGSDDDEVVVEATNAPPVVHILSPSEDQLLPKGLVTISSAFSDRGLLDSHACTVRWDVYTGDLVDSGVIASGTGGMKCSASRSLGAGVYQARVTVNDDDGAVGEADVHFVIYDASAGFVTGAGSIDSPAGAYVADPSLTGKAVFGFVSKYKKGATAPDGSAQFLFQTGDLNFHSDTYEWLVVAGGKAQFKGIGTVNGQGRYGFLIFATDAESTSTSGDADAFRIQIWNKDERDAPVYDNKAELKLRGGSVVIHTGGS